MKYKTAFTVLATLALIGQVASVTALFLIVNPYLAAAFGFSVASGLLANSALFYIESRYNAITQAEFIDLLSKQQGLGNEITPSGKFN